MRLTVFGASGRIGRHVVGQALDDGHEVTAVVRNPARLDVTHPALTVATVADLTDPVSMRAALVGADAAISGVGPRSRADVTVASSTARGIVRALEATRVRRFVAVTAAPVGPVPAGDSWLNRRVLFPLITTLLRTIYADMAIMEDEIRRSNTDWTIVRPPRLVNGRLTRTYRTAIGANVPRAKAMSRADVAHAMLAVLDNPATVMRAVGISG